MSWKSVSSFRIRRLELTNEKSIIAYVGPIKGVPDGVIFLEDQPEKPLQEIIKNPKLLGNLDAVIDVMRPIDVIDVIAMRDELKRIEEQKEEQEGGAE